MSAAPIVLGLDPDHQVTALLVAAALAGFVIWLVRAFRNARHTIDHAPQGDRRWHGSITTWDDHWRQPVDVHYDPHTTLGALQVDAETAARWVAAAERMESEAAERTAQQAHDYLADMPYNVDQDGGL